MDEKNKLVALNIQQKLSGRNRPKWPFYAMRAQHVKVFCLTRSFLMMLVGLAMILVHDEEELDPADESTDVFIRDEGEIPPPEEEQLVNRGPW